MVIEAGTESSELLLMSVTEAPPLSAGFESVTVQLVLEFGPRALEAHCVEEIPTGATSESAMLFEEPL
jgi:hypothetical protein